jgi:SAM-dependent methyltransferase
MTETAARDPLFADYGNYYDALYADKDYVAEAAYISALIKAHGQACHELLEFGSGTGKHGRLLAQQGYVVDGIERSETMMARQVPTAGFRCRLGDARSTRLGKTVDAVLALFHVLNYQLSDADVQAFFGNAADHLLPGGIFIFDTWYSPAVRQQQPETRVKQVQQDGMLLVRTAEPRLYPGSSRVDVTYSLQVKSTPQDAGRTLVETHAMRHFGLDEIEAFGREKGFSLVTAEEFLSAAPPSADTWGVTVVMRKD